MNRRTLIATAASTFAATVAGSAFAQTRDYRTFWGFDNESATLSDAQKKKHFIRLPELDVESEMDFAGGFKRWQKEYGNPETNARRTRFVESLGLTTGRTELSFEDCYKVLLQDPAYQAEIRLTRSIQELMWARARAALYRNYDLYMSAMEATDATGPGSLELNPSMDIPEYTTHEIHQQPGGYVGDPLAGLLYHYALATAFYQGLFPGSVRHDEPHHMLAAAACVPADGKVRRVLELGCSDGRTTIALKERFPDAEVWGIDVGGPMVRYAHHRAASMGLDNIHFAQRLAENTKFPDNHFDMVYVNLLFHEVAAFAARKIVPEIHRVLRPGGTWSGDASGSGGRDYVHPGTIVAKAASWVNHRFNHEPWEIQNLGNDFPAMRKAAGFAVDASSGKPVTVKA
jgi:SAM-dependent methyltransferase